MQKKNTLSGAMIPKRVPGRPSEGHLRAPEALPCFDEGMGEISKNDGVRVRRVYDPPEPADGARVLVDRLWPRGLAKADARLTAWCKDAAPSTELRRWYAHRPERFAEFAERYRVELDRDAAQPPWGSCATWRRAAR